MEGEQKTKHETNIVTTISTLSSFLKSPIHQKPFTIVSSFLSSLKMDPSITLGILLLSVSFPPKILSSLLALIGSTKAGAKVEAEAERDIKKIGAEAETEAKAEAGVVEGGEEVEAEAEGEKEADLL